MHEPGIGGGVAPAANLPALYPDPSQELSHGLPRGTHARGAWRILFGADGLRAGWSLLLFLALITMVQRGVDAGFHSFHHRDPDEMRLGARLPGDLLVTNGIPFVAVVLAVFLMSRLERRPMRAYGIGRTEGAGRQFRAGLFWGAGLLAVLVLALWSFRLLVFDGVGLTGFGILRAATGWGIGFLCVGLFEEYAGRGYVQFTLARGMAGLLGTTRLGRYRCAIGFWLTAAVTSFLFGAGHSHKPGESPFGLISAGLLAVVFCLSLWRTGSLWWAVGMHTAWDWAQSCVFGVADSGHVVSDHLLRSHPAGAPWLSGGLTGPEGSILCLPVIAVGAAVVLLTLPGGCWPVPGSRVSFVCRSAGPRGRRGHLGRGHRPPER